MAGESTRALMCLSHESSGAGPPSEVGGLGPELTAVPQAPLHPTGPSRPVCTWGCSGWQLAEAL